MAKYPLISDQITKSELMVVLRELEQILVADVPGSIVEFGCYSGTTSLFIRRLLLARNDTRQFHVYDSFQGLPSKTAEDQNAAGIDFRAGELAISKRQFTKNFERAALQLPVIHKGWFEQLQAQDVPAEISFAFLDGDFYSSIYHCLELVWPRLTKDGCILVHDYNRETLPGVERAVSRFLRSHSLGTSVRVEANIGILLANK